jgi:hypothetical protein
MWSASPILFHSVVTRKRDSEGRLVWAAQHANAGACDAPGTKAIGTQCRGRMQGTWLWVWGMPQIPHVQHALRVRSRRGSLTKGETETSALSNAF